MFEFWLFLATHLPIFRHRGLRHRYPKWWPEAKVIFNPTYDKTGRVKVSGGTTIRMAIGNAVDYAEMWKGKVIPA